MTARRRARTILAALAAALAAGHALEARAWACADGSSPLCVAGAEVKTSTTSDGVVIVVTGKDAGTVAAIQAAAAKPAERAPAASESAAPAAPPRPPEPAVYFCPLGHYTGARTADGLCPTCRKSLQERANPAALRARVPDAPPAREKDLVCPNGHYKGKKTPDGRCPVCKTYLRQD